MMKYMIGIIMNYWLKSGGTLLNDMYHTRTQNCTGGRGEGIQYEKSESECMCSFSVKQLSRSWKYWYIV
jgi:hypothetical protein